MFTHTNRSVSQVGCCQAEKLGIECLQESTARTSSQPLVKQREESPIKGVRERKSQDAWASIDQSKKNEEILKGFICLLLLALLLLLLLLSFDVDQRERRSLSLKKISFAIDARKNCARHVKTRKK